VDRQHRVPFDGGFGIFTHSDPVVDRPRRSECEIRCAGGSRSTDRSREHLPTSIERSREPGCRHPGGSLDAGRIPRRHERVNRCAVVGRDLAGMTTGSRLTCSRAHRARRVIARPRREPVMCSPSDRRRHWGGAAPLPHPRAPSSGAAPADLPVEAISIAFGLARGCAAVHPRQSGAGAVVLLWRARQQARDVAPGAAIPRRSFAVLRCSTFKRTANRPAHASPLVIARARMRRRHSVCAGAAAERARRRNRARRAAPRCSRLRRSTSMRSA
jgi:hypothetical protein